MARMLLLCVVASGCLQQSTITVTVSGTGTGTVTSDPMGLMCGGGSTICTLHVDAEGLAKLTATPLGNDTFTAWSGDCSGVGVCYIDGSFDATVDAQFTAAAMAR